MSNKLNFGDIVFLKEGKYVWSLSRAWHYGGWTCPKCKRKLPTPSCVWNKDTEETFHIQVKLFGTGDVMEDVSEEKLCMRCFGKRFGLSEEERAVLKTYMVLRYEQD